MLDEIGTRRCFFLDHPHPPKDSKYVLKGKIMNFLGKSFTKNKKSIFPPQSIKSHEGPLRIKFLQNKKIILVCVFTINQF